jgi:hypothetical protein
MFLKDKYLATSIFERLKARPVAGGDQQDKSVYENLSSPTVADCCDHFGTHCGGPRSDG